MARETKIGLLVGMGFIVCFAIILSHRGKAPEQRRTAGAQPKAVAGDLPAAVNASLAEQRARDLGRNSRPGTSPSGERPAASPVPQAPERDRPSRLDTPQVATRGGPGQDTAASGDRAGEGDRFSRRGEGIPLRTTDSSAGGAGGNTSASPEPIRFADAAPPLVPHLPDKPSVGGQDPEQVLAALAGVARTDEPSAATASPSPAGPREAASADPAKPSVPPAVAVLAKYEVQPGDNLTRIARKFYGSATPPVVKAIQAANKDAIPSPDRLVVGREIVLPMIEGKPVQGDPSAAGALSETLAATGSGPEETGSGGGMAGSGTTGDQSGAAGRDYQVKAGDTLARIARENYNSSDKRIIKAICEANRDKLSAPDKLIVGQKIVLPPIADGETREAPAPAGGDPPDADPPSSEIDRSLLAQVDGGASDKEKPYRWYQLNKGEVYSTVAADQLGTSKRWRELADLNKDIFPDPGKIRPGVKIRIPVETEKPRPSASGRTSSKKAR